MGSRNRVLHEGPDPAWEEAILGERGAPLQSIGILCSHLCKNSLTDRDAAWIVGSVWLKES